MTTMSDDTKMELMVNLDVIDIDDKINKSELENRSIICKDDHSADKHQEEEARQKTATKISPNISKPIALEIPCDLCGIMFNSELQANAHFDGKKHKSKLERNKLFTPIPFQQSPTVSESSLSRTSVLKPNIPNYHTERKKLNEVNDDQWNIVCNLCNKGFFLSEDIMTHFEEKVHQDMEKPIIEAKQQEQLKTCKEMDAVDLNQQLTCNVCQISFNSVSQVYAHFTGKKHKAREKKQPQNEPQVSDQQLRTIKRDSSTPMDGMSSFPSKVPRLSPMDDKSPLTCSSLPSAYVTPIRAPSDFYCNFCNITVNSKAQLERHCSGIKHKVATGELQEPPSWWAEQEKERSEKEKARRGQLLRCDLCKVTVNSREQFTLHTKGRFHRNNMQTCNGIYETFVAPKGGNHYSVNEGSCAPLGSETHDSMNTGQLKSHRRNVVPDGSFIISEGTTDPIWRKRHSGELGMHRPSSMPPPRTTGPPLNRPRTPTMPQPYRGGPMQTNVGRQRFQDFQQGSGQGPISQLHQRDLALPSNPDTLLLTDASVMMAPPVPGPRGLPPPPLPPFLASMDRNVNMIRVPNTPTDKGIFINEYRPRWMSERRL